MGAKYMEKLCHGNIFLARVWLHFACSGSRRGVFIHFLLRLKLCKAYGKVNKH